MTDKINAGPAFTQKLSITQASFFEIWLFKTPLLISFAPMGKPPIKERKKVKSEYELSPKIFEIL